jgi:DNA adenine methylase
MGQKERVPPFLRWAGGKRWLASRIHEVIGSLEYRDYYEPFLGGGSIFFGLNPSGRSFLSDLNAELVETYRQVRKNPKGVFAALIAHENTPDHYYELREVSPESPIERAARFIFLNHTSFNGLYRVNRNGMYNVPYGYRPSPKIPDEQHLINVAHRLKNSNLAIGDFRTAVKSARKADLVFLDPPYTIAHSNNGFVEYNKRLFAFEDQQRLALLIDQLRKRGAYFIMTNAFHESIADLFDRGDRKLVMVRQSSI